MTKYLQVVRDLASKLPSWDIHKIPRADNSKADKLSKFLLVAILLSNIFKNKALINRPRGLGYQLAQLNRFGDPILSYLRNSVVLADRKEVRKLIYQATNYTLIDDVLYK